MVIVVYRVVDSRNVHLKTRALHSTVDRTGNKTRIVEMADVSLHSAVYLRALLGVLERLLVKERPKNDRGVVTVTAYHYIKVVKHLVIRLKSAILVHNDHTKLITRVKNLFIGKIMRATVCVRSHLLESLDPVINDRIGYRNTNARVILVIAGSHYEKASAV